MKKTSKKLLSFFLAVVMVVTSCSVGLTAFAADPKKSMWNTTSADSSASFDALDELANQYVPSLLLGIGMIKDGVYAKYASDGKRYADISATDRAHEWDEEGNLVNAGKTLYTADTYKTFDLIEALSAMSNLDEEQAANLASLQKKLFFTAAKEKEIADNVTFQDILGVLQPTLLGLLKGSSKDDFLDWYSDQHPEYKDAFTQADGFDYLDDNGLTLSYYDLIAICRDYKDSDSSGTLQKWYDALLPLASLFPELFLKEQAKDKALEAIAAQINGKVDVPPNSKANKADLTYADATLYELKNFNFDVSGNEALISEKIKERNDKNKALGIPVTITDFAEYVYYVFGAGAILLNENLAEYCAAIETAGSKLTYKGTKNAYNSRNTTYNITTNITFENFDTVLTEATLAADGAANCVEYLKPQKPYDYDEKIADLQAEKAAAQATYNAAKVVFGNYGDEANDTNEGVYSKALNVLTAEFLAMQSNTAARKKAAAKKYFFEDPSSTDYNNAKTAVEKKTCYKADYRYTGALTGTPDLTDYTAVMAYVNSFDNCRISILNTLFANEITIVKNIPAYPAAGSFKPVSAYDTEIASVQAEKDTYESYNISEDYAKSYMSLCNVKFFNDIVRGNDCFRDILIGLAIQYDDSFESAADVEKAALKLMPNGTADCTLSDADFEAFAELINKDEFRGQLTETFWSTGYDVIKVMSGNEVLAELVAELPASIKNTAVSEYFGKIDLNRFSNNDDRRLGMYAAFANKDMATVNAYFAEAYDYAFAMVAKNAIEAKTGYTISYIDDTEKSIASILDVDLFLTNIRYTTLADADLSGAKVVLTQEQKDILCATGDYTGWYDLTDAGDKELGTNLLNNILNTTIVDLVGKPLLGDTSIEDLINNFFVTKVNLVDLLNNIWKKLVDSPVNTIFELVPLVVVVLDELLLPMIVNGENDSQYQFIQSLLEGFSIEVISQLFYENGSYIGIDQIGWDLNVMLPNIMHWITGDKSYPTITYYNGGTDKVAVLKGMTSSSDWVTKEYKATDIESIDFKHYAIADADGNALTKTNNAYNYLGNTYTSVEDFAEQNPDATFTATITYEGNVPHLTGIYIADKALRDTRVSDVDKLLAKLFDYENLKDEDGNDVYDADGNTIKVLKKDENGKDIKSPSDLPLALGEVVKELAQLFTASLDTYIASDFVNEKKYDNTYDANAEEAKKHRAAGNGLNNIFVALPRLFDIMEDLAADKYGVDKDAWVYCYEGKLVAGENPDEMNNAAVNAIKAIAKTPNAVEVLDIFSELLVENWLNAILTLVSNMVSTDNKISQSLPIISGLLNSLGGFGEQSIITDLLNSIFQLTRANDYSFTFSTNHTNPNNKMNGWNKNNAYFLICNIPRLVEVITNLIGDFNKKDEPSTQNDAISTLSAVVEAKTPTYKPGKTVDAKASSANYSSSDLSNTKDLIKNLDTMLSSLLSDSTLNDFSLGSTETILSGVTSLLNNYLSDDVTVNGNATVTDILRLVNKYLYYITGQEKNVVAKNNKVNAKTTYSNNALTGLVVETYALIEKIADTLLSKQFTNGYENDTIQYNLLVEAIDGIIAPDAIAIRLGDYPDAQKAFTETKYKSWTEISKASSRNNYKTIHVDWGFKDGDKEGFYAGLASSLRLVSSILGVLLVETGWYDTVVTPVLGALCDKNGIKLTPYKTLVKSKNATGYYDETLKAVVSPIAKYIDALLGAPASTLIKTVQGIAGILDDKNTKAGTIKSILSGAISPIANELKGAGAIFSFESSKLFATSPTLTKMINGLVFKLDAFADPSNIKLGSEGYKYGLSGKNLVPIINSYLAKTGITLKQISWSKLYSSTPEAALVYVVEYLLETILDNKNLTAIAGLINNDIVTMIIDAVKAGKINAKDLLGLINTILEATDSPTLAYWSFAQYLQELTESFKYPKGITKAMADMGVENLDGLVASIFPLLSSLGVDLGGDSLQALVNNKLFTNDLLTKIATALYGALDGLDPTIKAALAGIGIVTSTKDIAKILTDKSYGATYSSAAKTIKAQSSWKNVKNINWGFKDGSAKAQQGFVNALAAILRPINGVLQIFLNEGNIKLNDILGGVIDNLTIKETATTINVADGMDITLRISMSKGVLTIKAKNSQSDRSATSTIKLDLRSLKNLDSLKIEGTNGYNSAIIPLLEAFGCTGLKTYKEYQRDVKSAKDNALLDILNPLIGAKDSSFLNKLLAAPVKELTALLPSIAMYLDAHGLSQLLNNLLAPVTNIIAEAASALKVDAIVNDLLGMSLADLVSALLGVQVDLDLTDLSKLNIEDLIIPIVNMVLSGLDNPTLSNLKIFDIDWNALISLGTKATYTSKATGADGKQLTGKMLKDVDSGKVLITVLRYVAKTLIANATAIKNLVCGIDAVKKNDLIKTIVASVFNTIGTASTDELVAAVFYLFAGNPTNAFWDYSAYKTGNYKFTYPGTVDVDFLKNLPPMLDGLIGGLIDLNGLISEKLFTDELVGKLATALYGAIEGVKVGDSNLTALLAQTDIDFSTENVAKLLTDKAYGKTFDSAASVIKSAGSWKNIKAESLKFGVTDRDSFFHALVAVLRPIYGVLDVLLNDASLSIFNIVHIPGSDGYTSSIVPLMEAFSCYNVKTQYQYRQDAVKEYDALLLDIINPIWDKVEDILAAPLQTLTSMLPNLALLIGNDGLCQILDNLLTPVSALLDAIRPVIDLNDLLPAVFSALKVDLNSLLGKVGIKNFKLDIYDINKTLKPILGGDNLIPLVNNILGLIKIKGTPLGIKLNAVDWLQLASHGKTIIGASQAATYGARIFVEGDSSETLIAVLRYLIDTVNAGDNFKVISSLIAGLLGDNVSDSISDVIDQVLGMLQGDTDEVISQLVDLLQTFA